MDRLLSNNYTAGTITVGIPGITTQYTIRRDVDPCVHLPISLTVTYPHIEHQDTHTIHLTSEEIYPQYNSEDESVVGSSSY